MENSLNAADAIVRLEEPFASKDVKWLVAATSRDGRKGRVTPYADPRAYTDRLNLVFTVSGWTRHYDVHTVSPVTRIKKDKPIQTGKVLVTCVVSIPGVGTHSGSGEEWADDENAMTSADLLVLKAVSYFWRHSFLTAKCGPELGGVVNPDTGVSIENPDGGRLTRLDFRQSQDQ